MSGTSVFPVKVATNSDFSVSPRAGQGAESVVALPESARQKSAAVGNSFPVDGISEQVTSSREAVAEAVKSLAQNAQHMARKLEFSVNEPSGKVVVTVFDKVSDEVIRQIPGESAIAIAEHIASLTEDEPILGLLLDSQA